MPSQDSIGIEIKKQDSLSIDKFSKNGIDKELHTVCKVLPFEIQLQARGVSFVDHPLTIKLVYDWDEENEEVKEVEAHKKQIVESTTHVSKNGSEARVEIKIHALTSQHNGIYFRVVFFIEKDDKIYETISQPIKVVSKKKLSMKKQSKRKSENGTDSEPEILTPPNKVPRNSYNPDSLEVIAQTLIKVQQQQQEQTKLMDYLVNQRQNSSVQSNSFESAFRNFLDSFMELGEEERKKKVGKVIHSGTERDLAAVNAFMRAVVNEISDGVKESEKTKK